MNNAVSNNPAQHRFELEVDGHIAATYYELSGGVITFVHTEVPRRTRVAKASDQSWSRAHSIRSARTA